MSKTSFPQDPRVLPWHVASFPSGEPVPVQIRYEGITGGPIPTDLEATEFLFKRMGLAFSRRDYAEENEARKPETRLEMERHIAGAALTTTKPAKTLLIVYSGGNTELYFNFNADGKLTGTDANTETSSDL